MQLFSPAKINLGLEIGCKRPQDGYHWLNSIFIPISFGDVLEVHPALEDTFTSENKLAGSSQTEFEKISERGNLQKNLIWQALEKTRSLRFINLHVHLIKNIPLGSGLGGASSNAGVFLRYIFQNCLSDKIPIQSDQLSSIALGLGTDLPFFLQTKPQLVSGIGECLEPLNVGPGLGVLALTGLHSSSAQAYFQLKRSLLKTPPPKKWHGIETNILKALRSSLWRDVRILGNDFEPTLFVQYPELRELKNEFLKGGADYALMSGSGSSVYALAAETAEQSKLTQKMEAKFPQYRFVPFSFWKGFFFPAFLL